MTSYDLTPLLRSSVGFDVFDNIFDSVFNLNESSTSYPPYNIIKSNNNYTITMAIAGFTKDEVDISVEENELSVKGVSNNSDEKIEFLHKGIAARNFERKFQLADTIKVIDASYENGLLNIFLEREIPEHQKSRKIEINNNKVNSIHKN
jgi:molecular chaperone IbpA|tara:strand:+ start:320 stop:766 length:447 start_codon:yes stop_codon:yes gene_type:complete